MSDVPVTPPGAFGPALTDPIPLCVDLDGTVVNTDCSWRSAAQLLSRDFLTFVRLAAGGWRGRAWLKREIGRRVRLPVELLPYNSEVISLINRERAAGRKVLLVTASDQSVADAVGAHLNLFDELIGSDGTTHLKGKAKAALLEKKFGSGRFDYVGDSRADVPVWEAARHAYLVRPSAAVRARMAGRASTTTVVRAEADAVNVLGVAVSPINMGIALERITGALARKEKGYICVTGVHGVSEAQSDPGFRAILNGAFLCTPDGMPLVWVGRWQGQRQMARVYGPDLMLATMKASEQKGWRHFFYGGANGTAEALRRRLLERHPKLEIVGTHEPPFRPLTAPEEERLKEEIGLARPDVMWIGLSTPKQERFMAAHLEKLEVTLMIGVGAAFDIHAGKARQAPAWMRRSGLEWLFRLVSELRRLWKRYLKNNPLFVWRIFCQFTGLRKYPFPDKRNPIRAIREIRG